MGAGAAGNGKRDSIPLKFQPIKKFPSCTKISFKTTNFGAENAQFWEKIKDQIKNF